MVPICCARAARACSASLLDRARCRIALLRDDHVLDGLALLVHYSKWFVGGGVHQLHLNLAEFAVPRLIGWVVSHRVLISQRIRDRPEDAGELAIESREERHPARLLGERTH